MTQALATFGVYGRPSSDEIEVLELANEYRQDLCRLIYEQHCAEIDWRDRQFPDIFPAMVAWEAAKAKAYDIEVEIKKHHSEVRDRDAVTHDQKQRLTAARAREKETRAAMKKARDVYFAALKEFREVFKAAADWKNVKSLSKRREQYATLRFPDHLDDFAQQWMANDLQRRELGELYQCKGLHSSIRAEIVAASVPKRGKDGPGMRYLYGRPPKPQPWKKIILQIPGGLTVQDALDGKNRSLECTPVYTNHPKSGDQDVWEVRQQIGTTSEPRTIEYRVKFHRPLSTESTIKRWTLVVDGKRRTCIPILDVNLSKPTGEGLLKYDLSWTVCPEGVAVCTFSGDHVNETLVIPTWLVRKRMMMKDVQARTDAAANEALADRKVDAYARARNAADDGPRQAAGVALGAWVGGSCER